jgi:hypothetical protein
MVGKIKLAEGYLTALKTQLPKGTTLNLEN